VQAFLDRVYERTGIRAMPYFSPAFWIKYLGDTPIFATGGHDALWIAHWTTADAPTVPANDWGGYGWTFWQYTSSGSVPGIDGRVDLDRFRYTDFAPVLVP
jgi:GH25 family lysozyme M1 (1,4-beta-N-acetylmuramidase)